MKGTKQTEPEVLATTVEVRPGDELLPLLARSAKEVQQVSGVVVGELIGLKEPGLIPLVLFPGQRGTAAVIARTTVALHRSQIGRQIILVFEGGDAERPVVVGVLRGAEPTTTEFAGQVQVDADGERMTLRAKHQLVLTCGEASITLTAAGKVIIRGSYVSSHATGVNRVTGGSIELN